MYLRSIGLATLSAFLVMASGALAQSGDRDIIARASLLLPAPTSAATTDTETRMPLGWGEFCRSHPAECTLNTAEPEILTLTPQLWRRLQKINRAVNRQIEPLGDMEQWGVVERWTLPTTGKGDCEDYALLKRQRLANAGIPRRALLMTVVIDETGGGHAILTVRTDRGDFILDNKRDAILDWQSTGYQFVKREDQARAGWVGMENVATTVTAANDVTALD